MDMLFETVPLTVTLLYFNCKAFVCMLKSSPGHLMTNPIMFSLNVVYVTLFTATTAVVHRVVRACKQGSRCTLPIVTCLTTMVAVVNNVILFASSSSSRSFITKRMIAKMKLVAVYITATTASSAHFSLVPAGTGSAKRGVPRGTFATKRRHVLGKVTVVTSNIT